MNKKQFGCLFNIGIVAMLLLILWLLANINN